MGKILLTTAICLISLKTLKAQNSGAKTPDFFEYTQGSDSNKTNFTYDSAFKLKIHLKSDEKIKYVFLYEWNGKRILSDYFNNEDKGIFKTIANLFVRKPYPRFMNSQSDDSITLTLRFDYLFNKQNTDILNKHIKNQRDNCKSSNCFFSIDNLKPAGALKPGRKYSLAVYHDVNTLVFNPDEIFYLPENLLKNTNTGIFYNSKALLNKIYLAYKYFKDSLINPNSRIDTSTNIYKSIGAIYKNLYTTNNVPIFLKNNKPFQYPLDSLIINFNKARPKVNIFKLIDSFITSKTVFDSKMSSLIQRDIPTTRNDTIFKNDIKTVYDYYRSLQCFDAKKCSKDNCTDTTEESKMLLVLWSMEIKNWQNVNSGVSMLEIKSATTLQKDKESKNNSSQNIAVSIQFLSDVKDFLTKVQFQMYPTGCSNCKDSSFKICPLDTSRINHLAKILNSQIDMLVEIKNQIDSFDIVYKQFQSNVMMPYEYLGSQIDMYDANSYIMDFQTRSAAHITLVFGYCYYGFGSLFNTGIQGFSPYLGFQINFEPLNQNIPFRLINQKDFWQRLCFTTGWTLASVAKAGKRTDFFGNSSSLFTAFGFKLSHVFALNFGTLWFRAYNPNPLITDKSIAFVPSASLSINYSISQLLGDFTKLIPTL